MAMQKDYITESLEHVSYWAIDEIYASKSRKTMDVVIGAWATEEDRNTNHAPRKTFRRVKCTCDKFDAYFSVDEQSAEGANIYTAIYAYTRAEDDFFKDATDLL